MLNEKIERVSIFFCVSFPVKSKRRIKLNKEYIVEFTYPWGKYGCHYGLKLCS